MSLGIAFGAAADNASSGLIWGMAIGLIAGAVLDARNHAKTEH